MSNPIHIIGGGLAGSEAAWQAAEAGAKVRLLVGDPTSRAVARRSDEEGIGKGTLAAKVRTYVEEVLR